MLNLLMVMTLTATLPPPPIEAIWEESYIAFDNPAQGLSESIKSHVKNEVWVPEAIAKRYNVKGERKTVVFVVERTPHYPLLRYATLEEISRWKNDGKR